MSLGGDAALGGIDFDQALFDYVVDEFYKTLDDIDDCPVKRLPNLTKRLMIICKRIKEELAGDEEASVEIDE